MADEPDRAAPIPPAAAAWSVLGASSSGKADAFLDEQIRLSREQAELARLQAGDLRREDRLRHWSLRIRHISDVLKLGFELAVAFIVLAVAVGLGAAIWSAVDADGLVIESFAVPPAMTSKGLTGQVVASKLLDRLTVMQNETQSSRAPSSFADDWTNDIKVEIPDTGVSLGEVVRYLHGALGHEMHLSGEMYETAKGTALTVRLDNDPGRTFEAPNGDLDALIARAAEAIFARAQPYRYSVYLFEQGDIAKAYEVDTALAQTGPPLERAWASVGLGNALISMGRSEEARRAVLLGIVADPGLALPNLILGNIESSMSHEEALLTAFREADRLYRGKGGEQITPRWRAYGIVGAETAIFETTGDFRAAAEVQAGAEWFQPVYTATERAGDLALAHDPRAASALLSRLTKRGIANGSEFDAFAGAVPAAQAQIDIARQDWTKAAEHLKEAEAEAGASLRKSHGQASDRLMRETVAGPYLAVALANLGQQAEADAILKTLPIACDVCARAHGRVEAIRKHWAAAAHWFALAAARSPSVPLDDADWGQMLLARGDYDEAIAKFESANNKGPHFADPLEMWGEALMEKNRSDLALAKFEEANTYAPNWGRLHLERGEALAYTGDKAGAQKQFAIAAHLDLSSADRATLAKRMNAHG